MNADSRKQLCLYILDLALFTSGAKIKQSFAHVDLIISFCVFVCAVPSFSFESAQPQSSFSFCQTKMQSLLKLTHIFERSATKKSKRLIIETNVIKIRDEI